MPDLGLPDTNARPSHTSTQQWQSFEIRMRRRRAERCILRAEVALDAGFKEDAAQALDEARRLDPSAVGLDGLADRIAAAPDAAADAPPARRRIFYWVALAAGVILCIAAVLSWRGMTPGDVAPAHVTPAHATPADAAPAAAAPQVSEPAASSSIAIRETLVPATETTSAAAGTEPRAADTPPSVPVVPQRSSPVGPTSAPAVPLGTLPAVNTAATPPAAPVDARAPVSEPLQPLPSVSLPAARASETSAPRTDPAPTPPVDERARVRAVLARYEAAYSELDAAAARSVWPGVDEHALANAFRNLQSQTVSLNRCDVSVNGAAATAECAGVATWTPKVGGGGRSQPRRWSFDLRNAAGTWQIVRAEAR